jgi:hypothetical protein
MPLVGVTGSINPTALGGDPAALQNLLDSIAPALGTNQSRFYADPIGTAPGTTAVSGRVVDYKFSIDNALKPIKTGDGTPYISKIAREDYGGKTMAEFTLLFENYKGTAIDPAEVNAFLTFASRTVRLALGGQYLPCGPLSAAGGWPTALLDANGNGGSYGTMLDLAGKYTKQAKKDHEGRTAYTYSCESEVDYTSIGAPAQLTIVHRINPNA